MSLRGCLRIGVVLVFARVLLVLWVLDDREGVWGQRGSLHGAFLFVG
jgi:hypothetical protein